MWVGMKEVLTLEHGNDNVQFPGVCVIILCTLHVGYKCYLKSTQEFIKPIKN